MRSSVQRDEGLARLTWRADQRWALAATVAAFPFLFILDEATSTAFSPVLPGLVALLLVWLAAPYAAMEVRARRGAPDPGRVAKSGLSSKYAIGAALAWILLWLVFG